MQPERADLYFELGSSDKVYHIQLAPTHNGDANLGWSVAVQYGRRSSNLVSDTKCAGAVYEDAKKIYDRVLREKLTKGYKEFVESKAVAPALSVSRASVKEYSGHAPELLSKLTRADLPRFIRDDRYWFQPKRDGNRLGVRKNGNIQGINKLGQLIQMDRRLVNELGKVALTSFLIDGEIEATGFYLWDILEANDQDFREQPYAVRFEVLQKLFGDISPMVHIVPTWSTAKDKAFMAKQLEAERHEGIAIKDSQAFYRPGRGGQHFKLKFTESCTVIVGPKEKKKLNDGHRSFGMYLLHNGKLRYMGSCGCPDKYPLPTDGQLVEVVYLYCGTGDEGHLVQAKYFGKVRDDVTRDECTTSQVKVKRTEAA